MSCRHDIDIGTCRECYQSTGTAMPNSQGTELDGTDLDAASKLCGPCPENITRRCNGARMSCELYRYHPDRIKQT